MIWAHYSDKHKGLCLAFEIPSEVEAAQTRKVDYISAPLPFPADFRLLDTQQQLPMVEKMIFTKYRNWEYEHEIRTWTDLEEEFFDFCEMLQLGEVIIGAGSALPAREVMRVVVSHSVTQSEFAAPLMLDMTHSGWYCEERGKRSETSSLSEVTLPPILAQSTIREEHLLKDGCATQKWRGVKNSKKASRSLRTCSLYLFGPAPCRISSSFRN